MKMPNNAMNDIPDDALLVLFANGDIAAAQVLTQRLTPRILGFATRLLQDHGEAEDVAQEAMLRLWKIAPQWRQNEAKVSTWLYQVVSNLCTDRLRKKRGVGLDQIAEPFDDAPSAASKMQSRQRAQALNDALGQLPERQKIAVILRHIEGLKNPEIAKIMALSVEAVESLIARGKRALASILLGRKDELGFEDDG